MEKTCYQILAVPSDASSFEIRRSFRHQVRRCHPDSAAPGMADEARFQELLAAYRLLSSPVKRSRYDARLSGAPPAAGPSWGRNFYKFCGARWHWLKSLVHRDVSVSKVRTTSVCYRPSPIKVRTRNQFCGPSFSQVLEARRQAEFSCYERCEDGIIRPVNAVGARKREWLSRPRRSNLTVALRSWWGVFLVLMLGAWEVFRR